MEILQLAIFLSNLRVYKVQIAPIPIIRNGS